MNPANFLSNPTVRSYILAAVRHAVTYGGGLLSAYLLKKGASTSDAASLVQGLTGIVLAGVSITFSIMDVNGVDKKINAAIKLAPDSPPATIAALKQGHF